MVDLRKKRVERVGEFVGHRCIDHLEDHVEGRPTLVNTVDRFRTVSQYNTLGAGLSLNLKISIHLLSTM